MTPYHILVVVGISQGALVLLTIALLLINRQNKQLGLTRRRDESSILQEPIQNFLLEQSGPREVGDALRAMPVRDALFQLVQMAAVRLPISARRELAAELRPEAWVQKVVNRKNSIFWWRRLEAARILAIVNNSGDRDTVKQLLRDKHPAVQTAATACLLMEPDIESIALVLDHLGEQAFVVRLYQFDVLRDLWVQSTPLLLDRLDEYSSPKNLTVWIHLAEVLEQPECLARVVELQGHPYADVRVAVAKALRKYFNSKSVSALQQLLRDYDWRVRAQAARGLGALKAYPAVDALAEALQDKEWWVRFRAALALAALGDAGRSALRAARSSSDKYAADMAAMVTGLSEGNILELAEQ